MEELKEMARQEKLEPITLEGLDEALYSFKDDTAKDWTELDPGSGRDCQRLEG